MSSLLSRKSPLSSTTEQIRQLEHPAFASELTNFGARLKNAGLPTLKPSRLEIFQVNIGKMCNQTCSHCHVDAGPDRQEIMTRETMEICVELVRKHKFAKVDLTGGAPEMNPNFRWFVSEMRKAGAHVMNRCNLTIILANANYHDLPQFFREHQVEVISSLPHYTSDYTDRQRGEGVFTKSIKALQMLNEVGYGRANSKLKLNLVYNPAGAFLPGDQVGLERDFKQQLMKDFGITFDNLYCITNMPISRFLEYLIKSENYESYMNALVNAFNPSAVSGVMCRSTVSVGWDGRLYDCDFNQMLNLPLDARAPQHIRDFDLEKMKGREIVVNQHCYGCTAGSGSSCGGATV